MCAGIQASIEGVTHAVGQRRLEGSRARRSEEEERQIYEEESAKGEAGEERQIIETGGIEEEAEKCLEAALEMEVEEEGKGKGEGKEGGGGTLRAL